MEGVEAARKRCARAIYRIARLPASTNITDSCRRTLVKLARSELSFLSRFSSSSSSSDCDLLSVNIGHLEAVVHLLEQPFVTGVSRVCKPIPLSPAIRNGDKNESSSKSIHVDIVCMLNKNPVWIIVSDRNPKYVSWLGHHKNKGLRLRIARVLAAVRSSQILKPSSLVLFFSHGIGNSIYERLQDEFGASKMRLEFTTFDFNFFEELESEWINVVARSFKEACAIEIKVDCDRNTYPSSEFGVKASVLHPKETEIQQENTKVNLDDTFCSLLSGIKLWPLVAKSVEFVKLGDDLINFDTTALIALVSGISNGSSEKLLATSEIELRQRFKGNVEFVIAQAITEIQNPIHVELAGIIFGKRGIICESVLAEFKELVSLCGGPNEKLRADRVLKCLLVVPDNPSKRMMSLPTTRKLALKNKIVFGTGDHWHAPTITANMAFVRAVSQTGMSLSTIEHRPRALTGDQSYA